MYISVDIKTGNRRIFIPLPLPLVSITSLIDCAADWMCLMRIIGADKKMMVAAGKMRIADLKYSTVLNACRALILSGPFDFVDVDAGSDDERVNVKVKLL